MRSPLVHPTHDIDRPRPTAHTSQAQHHTHHPTIDSQPSHQQHHPEGAARRPPNPPPTTNHHRCFQFCLPCRPRSRVNGAIPPSSDSALAAFFREHRLRVQGQRAAAAAAAAAKAGRRKTEAAALEQQQQQQQEVEEEEGEEEGPDIDMDMDCDDVSAAAALPLSLLRPLPPGGHGHGGCGGYGSSRRPLTRAELGDTSPAEARALSDYVLTRVDGPRLVHVYLRALLAARAAGRVHRDAAVATVCVLCCVGMWLVVWWWWVGVDGVYVLCVVMWGWLVVGGLDHET